MEHKFLFIIVSFQFVISSLFCQEIRCRIKSDFQEDSTYIRIIETTITEDSVVNLIFILPVEEYKNQYEYGTGIEECKKIADSDSMLRNTIFIQPDYIRMPWYGNHPSNSEIRQLDYTIEVISHIKLKYSYSDKRIMTYLLGFSKSGWGCMNIMIRYPSFIDGILLWDSPLSTVWNKNWRMEEVFGNEEHFMKNYYLMRPNAIDFEKLENKKIVIGGYDYFESQSEAFLQLLDQHGVNYVQDNSISYPHKWNKDWIYKLLLYCNLVTRSDK